MSHKPQAAAVVIQRKHQSAPKAHPADKEIAKAAEEIRTGKWVPDVSAESALDGLGLTLGAGSARGIHTGEALTLAEMDFTRDMNELGRHPRVVEALAKMKQEQDDAKTPEEFLEATWKLREMNSENAAENRWEGQERWMGAENEEMRRGQVLSPWQFHAQLCKVIGHERVLLSPHCVFENPNDKSGRMALYVRNPRWQGEPMIAPEYPQATAAGLRTAAETKLLEMKRMRAAGQNALADKARDTAAEMIQAATEILMEASAADQLKEPQLLRVGTLQAPLGTEWMMMHFDDYGVPKCAKFIGWRTALLTMVRGGAITEAEAERAFPVGTTWAANWYLEQLYMWRNNGSRPN